MTIRTLSIAASLAATLAAATPAAASSIAYVKGGNVYLTSPDAKTGYALSSNGGWTSPSQSDDGTLMVQRGDELYKATRSGNVLAGPMDTLYSGGGNFHGPFDPRISPDGANVAYWGGYDNTATYDGYNWWELDISSVWGPSDHFAMPDGEVVGQQDYGFPSWIDNARLLLSGASSSFVKQVAVYAVGGPDNSLVQWFSDPGAAILEQGVASRDGSKLAFAAGDTSSMSTDQIRIYTTDGLPSGNPSDPLPPDPVERCTINAPGAENPTFSPDGTQLAWDESDGIHVASVADLGDCSTLGDHLLIAGGEQPAWGPADVNPADAPDLSAAGTSTGGAAGSAGATGSTGSTGSTGTTGTTGSTSGTGAHKHPAHGRHRHHRRHHRPPVRHRRHRRHR